MVSFFVFILRRTFSPQYPMYSSYYIFDPPFLPFFVHSNGLNLTDDIFSSWHTTITGPCRALVFSLSLFPFVFYPQWHFSLQPYTSTVMRIVYVLHFRKTFTSFYCRCISHETLRQGSPFLSLKRLFHTPVSTYSHQRPGSPVRTPGRLLLPVN